MLAVITNRTTASAVNNWVTALLCDGYRLMIVLVAAANNAGVEYYRIRCFCGCFCMGNFVLLKIMFSSQIGFLAKNVLDVQCWDNIKIFQISNNALAVITIKEYVLKSTGT